MFSYIVRREPLSSGHTQQPPTQTLRRTPQATSTHFHFINQTEPLVTHTQQPPSPAPGPASQGQRQGNTLLSPTPTLAVILVNPQRAPPVLPGLTPSDAPLPALVIHGLTPRSSHSSAGLASDSGRREGEGRGARTHCHRGIGRWVRRRRRNGAAPRGGPAQPR
jgi:hypothetical protein